MNVSKFLKILWLAIICALSTYTVFGMHESKESAFQTMSLGIIDEKKYDVAAQELLDCYCLEKTEEEKKEEALQTSRTVNKKKTGHTRNIFRDFSRREVLQKLTGSTGFYIVTKMVMDNCMSPGFMVGNWMRSLTSEQVEAVVVMLEAKAKEFVHNGSFDQFKQLPENFFKMLVRKLYYKAYRQLIDTIRVDRIFNNFGQSEINWSSRRIESLALYSDLLAVSNSICPIQKLGLIYNNISKIEGLDSLTSLKTLHLEGNKITQIEGLNSLVSLQKLFLSHNLITNREGLDRLAGADRLAGPITVDLSYNPVALTLRPS